MREVGMREVFDGWLCRTAKRLFIGGLTVLVCQIVATGDAGANPLVHSSVSTGSTKWPIAESGKAVAGWGVTGAKYGEFNCGTCHVKNAGNIKRIRTTLTAPDATDQFPVQAAAGTVNFQSVTGPSSFGDDGRAVKTSSTLICEVCHSKTAVHRYDSSSITDFNHKNANQTDCLACHPHKQGFKPLACNACHGDSGTAQIWPKNAGADDGATTANIAGAHQLHMAWLAKQVYNETLAALITDTANGTASAKQQNLCTYCHDIGDTDHMSASVADIFRSAPKTFWGGIAETGTLGTFETTGNTCSNVDCHAQYGTSAAGSEPVATPDWYITPTHTVATTALPTTMNCAACHNNPNSDTAAKHTNHLNATATFGLSITCARCHDSATAWGTPTGTLPASGHLNGAFAMGGSVTQTYAGTFRSSFGGCGTNTCHNNGANGAPPAYTWGTAITNCTECHGTATTLTTNAHNEHMNNGYASAACTDCHTAATATTHINATVNIDAAKATYNGTVVVGDIGYGTCLTASCHNLNTKTVQSAAWNTAGDLACDACHYYAATPTATGNSAHARPLSTSHNDHFTAGKICAQCHGTMPTTTAHIGGKTSLADGATALQDEASLNWADASAVTDYTFNDTENSCYSPTNNGLGCHATAGAAGSADATRPDWDVAFANTECIKCHTNNTNTNVNPYTGLHFGALTISANAHDDSFKATKGEATPSATCVTCHTATPSTAHYNGTFNSSPTAVASIINFNANVGFTDSTTAPTCSPTGTGYVGCHTDGGRWKYKWSTTAKNSDGTECANCHGGFNNDWTFGTDNVVGDNNVSHNRNWDGDANTSEVIGNHSGTTQATKCNSCHVYGDGAYTWGTHHRNGQITMNSTVGYQRTSSTPNYGCTSSCHSNNTGHGMESSSWTLQSLAGPALDCTGCHSAIYNGGAGTHIDADGPGTAFIPGTTAGTTLCTACHTQHAAGTDTTGANKIIISTRDGSSNPIPTMTDGSGVALYSTHGYKIWLGGNATSSTTYTTIASATTEAQMCWGCHDKVTQNYRTIAAGTSVTISGSTITATGIDAKFPVGRWVTIFDTGARPANQGRTFKVASTAANSITVTVPTGEGALTAVTGATTITIVSPVSEWQVNENSATGTLGYNYGMLFTTGIAGDYTLDSNWTTATWRSGRGLNSGSAYNPAWYKRGAIQSTHTANIGGTYTAAISAGNSLGYNRTETKDAVANIRCSYCHDVHGTHDGVKGDPGGKPYLRGTWKGNPYAEDMAPQYGMSNWSITSNYGVVPRSSNIATNSGLATVAKAGAFWIDQNSGNPNSGSSATATGGLCAQCHTTAKTGTWTAADIGAIDMVAGENLWVSGYNGHANAVIGGAGGNNGTAPGAGTAERRARNIFTRTIRGSDQLTNAKATQATMNMGAVGTSQGYTYRGAGSGYIWYPRVMNTTETGTTNGRPYAFNNFVWSTGSPIGLTQDVTLGSEPAHDAQLNFHTFNCAKCHNPHASRLPKLMITNCLDANHNSWEDKSTFTGNALPTPWTGTRHSQWAAAQNCHRLDSRAVLSTGQATTLGPGWNKATPWLEQTSPNSTLASDPNP